MPLPDVLRALLTAPGPSGYETAPAQVWREAAARSPRSSGDCVGSSFARVPGTGDGPLLAVVGHIDEIGLIVTHIDDDGLPVLHRRRRLGPADARRPARGARSRARAGCPAWSARSRSTCSRRTSARRSPSSRTCTSTSAPRTATRRARWCAIGDVAVIAGEPVELPNGRVVSRAMDNRLGCFVALEAARLVAEAGGAPGDVAAVAAVPGGDHVRRRAHERVRARARRAIVVDVTHATDAPGRRRAASSASTRSAPAR